MGMKQNKNLKQKSEMADSNKEISFKIKSSGISPWVGRIKAINVAKPIWSSGCPT